MTADTFLAPLLRQTIVFCHGVLLCPLFFTWNCTSLSEHYLLPNRRILFFHSFLVAISGKVHRMGYFYHLDCHCLVIPNVFHNDRYEEHLKMLVCLQQLGKRKKHKIKHFFTRMASWFYMTLNNWHDLLFPQIY